MKTVAKFCLNALFLLHILPNGIVGNGFVERPVLLDETQCVAVGTAATFLFCVALVKLSIFMAPVHEPYYMPESRWLQAERDRQQLQEVKEAQDFVECDRSHMHEWRKLSDGWMPCCTTETKEACEIRMAEHKGLTDSFVLQQLNACYQDSKPYCKLENPLDYFMREGSSKIKRITTKKMLRQSQQAQQQKLFCNSSMLSARGNRNHNGGR